jgi:hypothetical protein
MIKLKELWLQRGKSKNQKLRDILNSLKDVSCKDCCIKYPPYIMDFDNRPCEVKIFNVGHVSKSGSVKRLLA